MRPIIGLLLLTAGILGNTGCIKVNRPGLSKQGATQGSSKPASTAGKKSADLKDLQLESKIFAPGLASGLGITQAPGNTDLSPIVAQPLADYHVCRLTPEQSEQFTFSYDAYKRILVAVARFTLPDQTDKATNIVYQHSPSEASAIVQDLIGANAVLPEKRGALRAQIETANARALSNENATVGCSQSLLTWEETRHMFGRAVADNYVAVQVNVRNLDGTNQFLLHDSQVAFLTPDSSRFPLFVGGRDRVLARALQQATTWNSARNLAVLAASGVAALGESASALTGGPALRDAFSVFSGTFVPFLSGKIPDLTVAQLRLMDDVVYSSANAYHVVVPTKGTVPFVTFVPLNIYVGTPRDFRKMSKDDLLSLASNMYVIVAGVHIAEVNPAVGLSKVSCPTTATGNLKLEDAVNNKLVCDVTGTSLIQVAKLKLLNSTESSDTVAPEGSLSVDGGSTTNGKVTFDASSLSSLTAGKYTVFLILPNGQETSTSVTITVGPVIVSASLMLADCKPAGTCTIILKGTNLGLLDKAAGLTADAASIADAVLSKGSGTSRSVSFSAPATAFTPATKLVLTPRTAGESLDPVKITTQ